MLFTYYVPTRLIVGRNCVTQYKEEFKLGRQALIVTGTASAAKNGSLEDVERVLTELGIAYRLFAEVEPNPSLTTVKRGGDLARGWGADFLVAIGGGSPLDAAKGIAVHATNLLEKTGLYTFAGRFPRQPLPIIAIPTTAGTGSEVTPYAVLTNEEAGRKQSFASAEVFPRVAFLDAKYTVTLPEAITIDTYLDAVSHAFEGYLALSATPMSDLLAERALRLLGGRRGDFQARHWEEGAREELLFASTLAGMVIAGTGTTLLHALGYPLTYYKGIPHGRANGLLFAEYLRFCATYAPQRVAEGLAWLGFTDLAAFADFVGGLLAETRAALRLTEEERARFAAEALESKNLAKTPGQPGPEVTERLVEIYRRSL